MSTHETAVVKQKDKNSSSSNIADIFTLNTISPAIGSKKSAHRVGRGIGSGMGKTAKRGHKGQHSRAGGYHKVGFEGGQMPLQRRLPKRGFNSLPHHICKTIATRELNRLPEGEITIGVLRKNGILKKCDCKAKVVVKGEITKAFKLEGILASAGAKSLIEKAGGAVIATEKKEKNLGTNRSTNTNKEEQKVVKE